MLGKKCKKCDRKISKDFDFCPYCGLDFRWEKKQEKEKDFGLLGKNDMDLSNFQGFNIRMPFGFNNLFNSLLKEVDKQFRELDRGMVKDDKRKKIKPTNSISISISTETGKKPEIKIKGFGPEFKQLEREMQVQEKIPKSEITEERAKAFVGLPRKEALTKVRRLSNKIVYEIELPGVENLKDVIINKLENSIEIKAFSKDKAYFKLIPLNLPILSYKLEEGKLILELLPQ